MIVTITGIPGTIDLLPGKFYEVKYYSTKEDRTTERTDNLMFFSKDDYLVNSTPAVRTFGFRFINVPGGDSIITNWWRCIELEDIVSIKLIVPPAVSYNVLMASCVGTNKSVLAQTGTHTLEFDTYTVS